MSNPFAFVDAVSYSKQNLIREGKEIESDYNPFLTNRAFSYHPDTVLYASEMNQYPRLDSLMQFEFYLHSLRPSKRFAKWHKPILNEDEEIVMTCLGINRKQAREALRILSKEELFVMKNTLRQEGTKSEER